MCFMSGRDCGYASQASPKSLSTGETSPLSISPYPPASPGSSQTNCGAATPDLTSDTPGPPSNADSGTSDGQLHSHTLQDLALDTTINVNHMELVIHFSLENVLDFAPHLRNLVLNKGLESPYLLYEVMAISARHLAFLYPNRAPFYMRQAFALQTRAVSLFNDTHASEAGVQVTEENCVAMLLFPSMLGRHLMTDALARRDAEPGALDAFLASYTQCHYLQRGIRAISSSAWSLLMESELRPFMLWGMGFYDKPVRGNHCAALQELIDTAGGLQQKQQEACREAVRLLQIGLDAILAPPEDEQYNRSQMIFSWGVITPQEYTDLLARKRPETLVVLAYYAVLLHYARDMWEVGDAGAYLLGIIAESLGPDWGHWLEWPRAKVTEDTG